METAPTNNTPAIEVEHLSKHFGDFLAVDDLSFTVPRGSVFGFLGPNGAGKTTTIGLLLGLVPIESGTARVLGYDVIRDLAPALERTGAVVEGPVFYPYLTGRKNLELIARLRNLDDPERISRTLDVVGLGEGADRSFGGYSTGMRQRLGLALVLFHEPDLLILDQPARLRLDRLCLDQRQPADLCRRADGPSADPLPQVERAGGVEVGW